MVIGFDWHSTARLANKILVKPGREAANMWAMLHGKTIHYFSTTNHIHIYSIINIINLKRGSLPILLGAYAGDYWLKANSHEFCRIYAEYVTMQLWNDGRAGEAWATSQRTKILGQHHVLMPSLSLTCHSFIHLFIHSFFQCVSSIPPAIVSLSLAILTQTTTERGPIKLTSYRVLYSVLSLLWNRLKECIHIQRIKPCPAFKTLWSTIQGLLQSNLQNSNKMKHAKANDTWLPWNLLICQQILHIL